MQLQSPHIIMNLLVLKQRWLKNVYDFQKLKGGVN